MRWPAAAALGLCAAQNAGSFLLTRYSKLEHADYSDMVRTKQPVGLGTRSHQTRCHGCAPQVAVLVAEGIKLAISTAAYAVECGGLPGRFVPHAHAPPRLPHA